MQHGFLFWKPPPPFESKIPFEGILYCYLPYLFQRVCSYTRGRGAFVRQNYIPKKSFCFVTFQKIFNKYEWKWKFISFFFLSIWFSPDQTSVGPPFLSTFGCTFSGVLFQSFLWISMSRSNFWTGFPIIPLQMQQLLVFCSHRFNSNHP